MIDLGKEFKRMAEEFDEYGVDYEQCKTLCLLDTPFVTRKLL